MNQVSELFRKVRPLSPLLIPFFLFIAGCSGSQSGNDDEGRYPLWKIEGKSNTVWLLGSVHMLPESAHPFPKAFQDAYNQADQLVFEIALDEDAGGMGMLMQFMSKAMLPAGQTLEDVLEEETWELLEPRLNEIAATMIEAMKSQPGMEGLGGMQLSEGVITEALTHMKPWVIGFMLQTSTEGMEEYRADLGVDLFYTKRAQEDGKPISGLETVAQQLGYFEKMTGDKGDEFIRSMLDKNAPQTDQLEELIDAWQKGDLEKLESLVNGSMKEDDDVYTILLTNRNRDWVPQIEDLLNDRENYLVVVGAGHLIGKESVVQLLRERGHRVVRQ